ncbi:lecithin:cholesterol acyltransferase [Ulvibacter antarcticus]|uniref:Lecithin:cholesterol acyltransferase n=2 Tax=Ulvibacter antarcticus TaxID=442714 RepID=A0A3L9ZDT3_9FLAO|nr:lecithin:cholesterol acyltransferase [Ulvibacter antarcticus]
MEKDADGNFIYNLVSSNRAGADSHEIDLEKDGDLMEFELDDGTIWMCDASTMHEIYPELDPAVNPSLNRDGKDGVFVLEPTIDAPSTERGIIGKIAIKVLKIFAKKAISAGVVALASKLEEKNLQNGIPEDSDVWETMDKNEFLEKGAGLFRIDESFGFKAVDFTKTNNATNGTSNASSQKPYFLFIHGTNSDTLGAYEDLKNSSVWPVLFQTYGENILAFQHRTLTKSPLENTVELAKMLPKNAELHLLTHSRGGLVGDVLSKYAGDNPPGFNERQVNYLDEEEKRERDVESIKELNKAFSNKKIYITKYIRVACPAAGTKLASQRLDHILNVFLNLLTVVGGGFGDVLKELLSEAIKSKADSNVLAGVEAMHPDSPFLKVLNDPGDDSAIEGDALSVISGNGRVSFTGQGLFVILGRLFYWQRNDLVVNTDSMYLGVKRKEKIRYFFDQAANVNHVRYFENDRTREAIEVVIRSKEGEVIQGFKDVYQMSVPGSDRGGIEHGELKPSDLPPAGDKPIVIMLPGIMGSNLSQKNKEIWLQYGRILSGGLLQLEYSDSNKIVADSVVETSYKKLYDRLSDVYDVVIYPFDWRRPLTACVSDFNKKIEDLLKIGQPIKIIGHSMGGVLVRDFMVSHPTTLSKLREHSEFKVLFLGSPLGGSHRIPAVLFGKDAIINKLSKLDLFHSKKRLLTMFSKFPGILSLLPLTDKGENDFANIETWQKMREYFGEEDWPLPREADLTDFRKYRDTINSSLKNIDYKDMVYIAGKDKMTPCGYYLEDYDKGKKEKKKLYFLYTNEGDQSVTWELGIPKKMIENDTVYYSRMTHGALANDAELFPAIEEILLTGETGLIRKTRPLIRGEEKVFRAEPDLDFDISEGGLAHTIFGVGATKSPEGSILPLNVTISNGDLRYASYPILAGHFLNDGILSAEKAIDRYLNDSLSANHFLGLYPGGISTHSYFDRLPGSDFPGSIIVGLGEPDQLTSFQLTKTIEQGVLNYMLRIRGDNSMNNTVGVSALVIGSGYGGLSVESSIKAIIEGVNRANVKIRMLFEEGYKTIGHLEFVELYENRALNCMYVINKIAKNENSSYNIQIGNKKIKNLLGVRKMIPLDTTDDWWKRITIVGKTEDESKDKMSSMLFSVSTGDSREEEVELQSSTSLIDMFVSEISRNHNWNDCTAKTLFELLIPNEFKEKLKRKGNMFWILDDDTASYPWELLQDNTTNADPLCIDAGMIRQLKTKDFRVNIKRVAANDALVIADPNLHGFIGQLKGAKREGLEVKEVLEGVGYPVNDIIGSDAATIIRSLFCKDYSIIHLAGHGIYNPDDPKKSGMVIGKDLFLTVFAIQQMAVVPELVFINCCHLGYSSSEDSKYYENRYKLAANIGTQLIRMGVRAVVAAGWAIDDAAASLFAKSFYSGMFSGCNFGDAVKNARKQVYQEYPENNTWGAYQCYGDPFFKLKQISSFSGTWSPSYIASQEAEVDLDNLLNKLEMATRIDKNYLSDLNAIIKAVKRDVEITPRIMEKEARIYQELGEYAKAIEGYEKLLKLENAEFSFRCMERYCNIRAKSFVREFFEIKIDPKDKKKNDREKEREEIRNIAYLAMDFRVIPDLGVLVNAGVTSERLTLLGSAYKRLSMLAVGFNERIRAYKGAYAYYSRAYSHENNKQKVYALTNMIELAAILKYNGVYKSKGKFTFEDKVYEFNTDSDYVKNLDEEHEKLQKKSNLENLDYWDMIDYLNIDLCLLLISEDDKTSKKWKNFIEEFKTVWQKAGSIAKKTAEIEHIEFLIHALKKAADTNTEFYDRRIAKDEKIDDNFKSYTGELKEALEAAKKHLKSKQNKVGTKKATKAVKPVVKKVSAKPKKKGK